MDADETNHAAPPTAPAKAAKLKAVPAVAEMPKPSALPGTVIVVMGHDQDEVRVEFERLRKLGFIGRGLIRHAWKDEPEYGVSGWHVVAANAADGAAMKARVEAAHTSRNLDAPEVNVVIPA